MMSTVVSTFFSRMHKTFARINLMLDHKPSISRFKKITVIHNSISKHSGMKFQINNIKN